MICLIFNLISIIKKTKFISHKHYSILFFSIKYYTISEGLSIFRFHKYFSISWTYFFSDIDALIEINFIRIILLGKVERSYNLFIYCVCQCIIFESSRCLINSNHSSFKTFLNICIYHYFYLPKRDKILFIVIYEYYSNKINSYHFYWKINFIFINNLFNFFYY